MMSALRWLSLLGGCGGGAVSSGDDTGSASAAPCDPCAITDAHNYHYAPTLSAPEWTVASGLDLRISWAGLTADLLGHALDPSSLDRALLLVFHDLSAAEILDGMAHDRLDQSSVTIALTCTPQDSGCNLSDFNLMGNHLDVQQYLVEGSGTWVVAPGWTGQAGVASLALFTADDGAEAQVEREIPDGAAALEVQAELAPDGAIPVADGSHPVFDWSALTVDALGNEIALSRSDRLRIGRYDMEPAAMEAAFLDLEMLATETWEVDVTGRTSLPTQEVSGFPGFVAGPTWVLTLECSTCMNPAPRFLGLVEVVSP